MLYPKETNTRGLHSLDGIWQLAYDAERVGLQHHYSRGLPPEVETLEVAVPASLNEQVVDRDQYHHMDWVWYERDFVTPALADGARVFLRFGAINYRAEVFLNGERLGEHEGGYMPFQFEVTERVQAGDIAKLVVRVDNLLDATTVPQGNLSHEIGGVAAWRVGNYPNVHYDFFPFTGIHRPVQLVTTGSVVLSDVRVTTQELHGDHAEIRVEGRVDGPAEVVHLAIKELGVTAEFTVSEGRFSGDLSIPGVTPWCPETPKLYSLAFTTQADGKTLDTYPLDFGFRTVEVTEDQLLLNGQPVFLRGFGKHEDLDVIGKGLSLPHLVKDANLMDWIGANSYRTSHYPYSEEALMQADRRGILVISETPANTLSMRAVMDDDAQRTRLMTRHQEEIERLMARDHNFASVICWSLGNECEDTNREESKGYYLDTLAFARTLDTSRPIAYVQHMNADAGSEANASDLVLLNLYPAWYGDECGRLDRIEASLRQDIEMFRSACKRPVILTEFGADAVSGLHSEHALMWSEEYQAETVREIIRVAESYPYCAGTHVWNFADFKVGQHTGRIILNWKGVFTRDRHPKLAAHTLKQLWQTPPKPIEEVKS